MSKKEQRKAIGDLIYRLLILVLLAVIAFSLFQIIRIVDQYQRGTKAYSEIAETVQKAPKDPLDLDWDALLEKNQDVRAWLYAKDTKINYPVVQGEDNAYYLHRLLDGSYDFKGTLFIDYRVSKPFSKKGFLTVIYGHAMRDGTMFKPLFKWKDQDWYDEHKTIQMATKKHRYDIEIFSVKLIKADDEHYDPDVSENEREDYIRWAREDSLIEADEGITVSSQDRIVMLSTCAEASGDNRVVVLGKLVRKD